MGTVVRWGICVAYTALVTRLSLEPSSSFRFLSRFVRFPHADKVVHFAMYGVLAALLLWASRVRVATLRTATLVVGVCCCYGLLMEVLQMSLLPRDRFFSLTDVAANVAGATVAVATASLRRGAGRGNG